MTTSDAIRTTGLCRRFGETRAVEKLDLRVARGSFYGLLGPNGAGKSTSVALLCGLLAPTAGTIEILGRPLEVDDPAVRRQLGVVFEEPALFELLSGWEQLTFTAQMQGLDAAEAERRAADLLHLLALEQDAGRLVADYSKGMRRKLAIACALVHGPPLLVLDEPFEGVDATAAETIELLLRQLTAGGATVLLTTHVLDVAERICQRVGILVAGRLAREVDTARLRGEGRRLADLFGEVVGERGARPELPAWLLERSDER